MNNNFTPDIFITQYKDTKYLLQLNKVFNAFSYGAKTMKEVDVECGVMRENICWYVRSLKKANLIYLAGKRDCKVTKRLAGVYTTNPELIPKSNQIMLF